MWAFRPYGSMTTLIRRMLELKRSKCDTKSKKNTNLIVFLIFIGIVLLLLSIYFVKRALNKKDDILITEYYEYNTSKSSDYYVMLQENMFYESAIMEQGKQYPSKLIAKIPFELKYNFVGSKDAKIYYTYNITAEIVGNIKNGTNANQEVWTREYVLIPDQPITTITAQTFNISEIVDINYNDYYNLVAAYEQSQSLALDATLKLKLNVKYNIDIPETTKQENVEDSVETLIPLNNTVTQIDTSKNDTNPKVFQEKILPDNKVILKDIIIAGVLFITGLVIIIRCVHSEEKNEQVLYQRNIDKILKGYGDLIVTVTNKPDLRGLKTLKLAIIDDVIDLAEQNKCNIIHYETSKNRESILYIIVEKYVYIYEITAETNL